MKKTLNTRDFTIFLIKNDLINLCHIHWYNKMGIDANRFSLDLATAIFDFLEINIEVKAFDTIMDQYLDLAEKAMPINPEDWSGELHRAAVEIYTALKKIKRQSATSYKRKAQQHENKSSTTGDLLH